MTREDKQRLLDTARAAQTAFWKSLTALEVAIGREVNGTDDLTETTLEALES